MYTRGFSTLGCADFSFEQAAALATQYHLPVVELRALGGSLELSEYLARTYGTPEAFAAEVRGSGVAVPVIDTSFRLIGGTTADREALLKIVPWAEALGVRWLRAFDGGTGLDAQAMADATDTVAWWRETRARRGLRVDLMVETHDVLVAARPILDFMTSLPGGPMPLLWDSHHTWKKGGEDPVATWRALRSYVTHIHVKDSVSIPQAKYPYTYVPPGTGEFPMEPLKATLAAEYDGAVSLEWEKWWHPYLAPLDTALASAAGHRWW